MINVIGLEAMLHISFSLAAFVFSIVLYILVCALGTGTKHKNLTFQTFVVTIVIGNLISILDNIFRDAGIFPTPYWIQLLLLLLVYLANIMLTFYMALYMETFFGEFRYKKQLFRLNTCIVISGIILTAVVYISRLMLYSGESLVVDVPIWIRVILGYVYELYYIIYSLTLFVIFNKKLRKRARMTSIASFTVVIGSILFELLNTFGIGSGILYNYFGAVLGLYIFYIGVETPDYRNLIETMRDLDAARRSADEANRSKSDFLANMSHEIRTPINAVLGMNEMILREAEDNTILAYADSIENAGRILLGLINDILDFSKIEAGKIGIIPADYDLSFLINDLVNMIHPRAEKKDLLLNLDFDRTMPRYLNGDEVRVKQVITNILTNAVKYTEKGSVSFSIGYEKPEDDPEHVILKVSVKDTGIGIKAEDLPKLFSEFERIEEKRNRNVEGTGLGMSITKKLLELMDSSLKVESTYGEGSVFYFDLKQKVVSWDELGDYEASYLDHQSIRKRYKEKFTAPDARVLVVDDNVMNLMVFKSLIKKTQMVTDTAENGDAGLKLASENKYDILFLDHMMPGKDGIETLHELRSLQGPNEDTPAVCLTANAISGAREKYIKEGFEGYLSKPINAGELENMLIALLPDEKIKPPSDSDKKEEGFKIPEELTPLKNTAVNVKAGIINLGSADEYMPVLKVFYESMDERTEELDRFYRENDCKNYTIRIHALKSSSRIIGDEELGELAEKLEDAGKREDMEYIGENHPVFMEEYLKLRGPLSEIFPGSAESGGDRPEADPEYIREVYKEIKGASEDFDTERLDTILKTMEGYSIPAEEAERWKKIRKACEELEYSEIPALLE